MKSLTRIAWKLPKILVLFLFLALSPSALASNTWWTRKHGLMAEGITRIGGLCRNPSGWVKGAKVGRFIARIVESVEV